MDHISDSNLDNRADTILNRDDARIETNACDVCAEASPVSANRICRDNKVGRKGGFNRIWRIAAKYGESSGRTRSALCGRWSSDGNGIRNYLKSGACICATPAT